MYGSSKTSLPFPVESAQPTKDIATQLARDVLTGIIRQSARQLLAQAVNVEVAQ